MNGYPEIVSCLVGETEQGSNPFCCFNFPLIQAYNLPLNFVYYLYKKIFNLDNT